MTDLFCWLWRQIWKVFCPSILSASLLHDMLTFIVCSQQSQKKNDKDQRVGLENYQKQCGVNHVFSDVRLIRVFRQKETTYVTTVVESSSSCVTTKRTHKSREFFFQILRFYVPKINCRYHQLPRRKRSVDLVTTKWWCGTQQKTRLNEIKTWHVGG